jgi:hypothetical protein
LGFKDPTLWPFFAGERKSGSSRQGSKSLLPGKKHPKLREISQIWATFGTKFLFVVCSAFFAHVSVWRESYLLLRIFFVQFGDSDPKDRDRIQIRFLE